MKVLSLAHMCQVESFTDKGNNTRTFFNGPSPDEVALVEFAASMHYDCTKISDDELTLYVSE